MRLDRFISHAAGCSRSESRAFIKAGRVKLDGVICKNIGEEIPLSDLVTLDDRPMQLFENEYLMMNKPADVITAAEDRSARTVMDLLPDRYKKIKCMPIGRLDKDTTGLLIFTTDGKLHHRLLSPGQKVAKVYLAGTRLPLDASVAEQFKKGIDSPIIKALPAQLEILESDLARVTVHEGQFHQIKRMFEAVGNEVTRLNRRAFAGVELDPALAPGEYRALTAEETRTLYMQAGVKQNIEG